MSYNDIPALSFEPGWLFTFAVIFLMNAFLLAHWAVTDFRTRRLAKTLVCVSVNVGLAIPFFIYFARFLGGMRYEPYMIPLSYFAGFYLCFSLYASGVFFFTDIFCGIRWLLRRRRERRRRCGLRQCELQRRRGLRFPALLKPRFTLGVAAVCVVCALAAFYTPTHITTTEYDVTLDRRDSSLTELRAVFISDTHTGGGVREKELDDIVARANAAKPDIVLLGGDIIDEGTPEYLKRYTAERFGGLESVYGTYYIIGNHDASRSNAAAVVSLFEGAGIRCLLDETVMIGGEFYLIGRDDSSLRRRPLSELEAKATENLPVVLLDHRPRVGEVKSSDVVELQLSGHTHDGQIFPFHVLDPLGLFTLNYGYYEKSGTQIIVSSGAGEFAVPVRLGSPAEILVVDITLR
ncbi:MAG: metallophosphoesterase [Clostridiales Family XIII bacterium]|jgi:predicted MPP superfamily phosphohydrolase|nr:metallophosphoesterase [Clostridiales Family XIII bacterium]